MKTIAYLIILMFIVSGFMEGEHFRNTTADMMMQSYINNVGPREGYMMADVRAEAYRRMYESCDEDHNCTNATAGGITEKSAKTQPEKTSRERVIPFTWFPVWL